MIPKRLIRCVPEVIPDAWEANWLKWCDEYYTTRVIGLTAWDCVTIQDPIDPVLFPLLGRYHRYATSGAQLAGMVRLETVWRYGGVYVDADMEPLRAIDELRRHPLFICTEDGVHLTDAMFGAEKNHPGLLATIEHVARLYEDWLSACAVPFPEDDSPPPDPPGAQATGPLATTHCLSRRPDVTVLAQRMFFPYTYLEPERAGEDFARTSPESYAVHRWSHSWAGT